jgi:hypothetical protein
MAHLDHPLSVPEEAPERGRLRKANSDGAQAAIWFTFLAVLALLIALGVAWGLTHRISPRAPQLQPDLPSLPGQQPAPKEP